MWKSTSELGARNLISTPFHHLLERRGHVVHGAVRVDDGVLHEAAVLVDLLLGDLRFRGRVSRTVELFWRRGDGVAAVLASRRWRGSYSGVAAAAWRVV